MDNLWSLLKHYYSVKFNIPTRVVDFIAIQDITKKSISGYSNSRIAYSVGETIIYIKEVLEEFLDFGGWTLDLDVNPLAIYNRSNDNFINFRQEILMLTSLMSDIDINVSFSLCRKYKKIESEINKYYGY